MKAAAARSSLAPKGGHLKDLQLHELAAPALQAVWQGIRHKSRLTGPESVILGNALGAGGNPARVAAIAAFGPSTAGVTIDTQCCSGIDTVSIATAQLRVNALRIIIAGGVVLHLVGFERQLGVLLSMTKHNSHLIRQRILMSLKRRNNLLLIIELQENYKKSMQ
jgi:acetyl-CoA acetyltransferase